MDLYLNQLLVCLLCALVDIGRAQRSAVRISQDIQATVAVLTVVGTILVCIMAGVIVYCICRPWSQLTSHNRGRRDRYVRSEHDDII